jgi:hypothetical protein
MWRLLRLKDAPGRVMPDGAATRRGVAWLIFW